MLRRSFALSLILVGLAGLVACARKAETVDQLMSAGVDALYAKNDAKTAIEKFHKVLDQNPVHYGATYQLATALDRAGKRDEARPYWEKMLTLAEASRDDKTIAIARARLGRPLLKPEETGMKAGLDALYGQKDPVAAAVEFRRVLAANPDHYGATYQLATALDRSGKPAEARPLWEKVLAMAEGYKDAQTVATARARLAQKP